MKHLIYADNAATTRLDQSAFEAMKPFLLDEYGNASQPYSFARKPRKALAEAREMVAACIGASPEEIFFTSGGTESDNWAIKGTAYSHPGKRTTIASSIEHHAVLRACSTIEKQGYPVAYVSPNSSGVISADALSEIITDQTGLVSVMMVNNEIGTEEPVRELAFSAHKHGALFHTDAVQAVGHIKVDVKNLDVDMLSASAHKFNGPKGVGFLYVRKGTHIVAINDGGSQEFGLRAGTENIASIVGMAVALKSNVDALEENASKIRKIEELFLAALKRRNVQFLRNGGEKCAPGIVSLSFPNADGEALLHRLDLMGISVSTGAACDNVNTQISHVLREIGISESLAKGTIRISFGRQNTEGDAEAIADALQKILS